MSQRKRLQRTLGNSFLHVSLLGTAVMARKELEIASLKGKLSGTEQTASAVQRRMVV
jgi:hypothetical protein